MILGSLFIKGTPTIDPRRHKLAGTVTVDGSGAPRRVMILERGTMAYVGSTIANSDGTWQVTGLAEHPDESLIVMAFDDVTKQFNAEVADFISQVATV